MNLPAAVTNPEPQSPYFAGILSPFGRSHHIESRPLTLSLEITRTLTRLRAARLIEASPDLRVTFVPRGPLGATGRLAPPSEMRMRLGRVQLVLLQ